MVLAALWLCAGHIHGGEAGAGCRIHQWVWKTCGILGHGLSLRVEGGRGADEVVLGLQPLMAICVKCCVLCASPVGLHCKPEPMQCVAAEGGSTGLGCCCVLIGPCP